MCFDVELLAGRGSSSSKIETAQELFYQEASKFD